jgi:putative transposase
MGGLRRFQVPEGWLARGWRFEVETTGSVQRALIAQHFGARRFAYNWALAQVKANLDARAADASVPPLTWTLPVIGKRPWTGARPTCAANPSTPSRPG